MDTSVKTCFKCGVEKPLDDFYKHQMMSDGHLNKCKECTKKDTKDNRASNHDYYKAYDLERSKLPHRKKAMKDRLPEYRATFPERNRAHQLVRSAVIRGDIKKLH